jgi:hypothetical protein
MRSLPDRYPDLRPVLDGVGKDFLRLAKTIAGIKQAIDSHAVPRPLLDLVEIAIVSIRRAICLLVEGDVVGLEVWHWPQATAPGSNDPLALIIYEQPCDSCVLDQTCCGVG